MMTTNFGYRLNPVGEGDGVFKYWDQLNLWPQLEAVLQNHFVPKGNFMVAPPAFATTLIFMAIAWDLVSVDGEVEICLFRHGLEVLRDGGP